jgi:hypothetical protein
MNEKVRPIDKFVAELSQVIRNHLEAHGLLLHYNELLIARDPVMDRVVITFRPIDPDERK